MKIVNWQEKYSHQLEEMRKTAKIFDEITIGIALVQMQLEVLRVKIVELKIALGSSSI